MSASADRVLGHVQDTMGPSEIGHIVQEAYADVKSPQEYEALARKETPRARFGDSSKPDTLFTRAEPLEDWETRIQKSAQSLYRNAIAQAEQKITDGVPDIGGQESEETDDGSSDEGEGADTEDQGSADDLAPASDATGAARAVGGQGAAPPASVTRSPRAHIPVTIDRVTAGADVQAQAALRSVKADPRILAALQTPAEPGKATVVKLPDGNLYYLAGNELKRLQNIRPPAKGK
jgi:hypothetical protein